MKLADRVAQSRTPLMVHDVASNTAARLSGVSDHAADILRCATRFVLSDELTRLCTALAFSKGARTFGCADLIRIPAESVWVEWCEAPWQAELALHGLSKLLQQGPAPVTGRRGALIHASRDGRRGMLRTFWSIGDDDFNVLASPMEAYFDFDAPEYEAPNPPDEQPGEVFAVQDHKARDTDILHRFFRFRFERSWRQYYDRSALGPRERDAIARHTLGTIAIAVPVLLSFFLLLGTRSGLPRRPQNLERLNHARLRAGRPTLLEHVEVMSPLLPDHRPMPTGDAHGGRSSPRRHHVRGHVVRRGDQIFWRVPHLRGDLRAGLIRSRTVTWTVDASSIRPRS